MQYTKVISIVLKCEFDFPFPITGSRQVKNPFVTINEVFGVTHKSVCNKSLLSLKDLSTVLLNVRTPFF